MFALNNVYAQNTYVADDNFEQALIDLGYDDVQDDYVLTENISGVTYLGLSDKIISDLTGVDDFASLQIQIDNETDAKNGVAPYDNWKKDNSASYSENCSSLGVDDEVLSDGLKIYPNPVSNTLTVESEIPIVKVEIFNVLGKKVMETKSGFNSILTENLSGGVFFIKIHSAKSTIVRRITKQ